MGNSKHLERQADQTREQLAATLKELRARLAPASLGRETLSAARRSVPVRFVTNLGIDARNNAVPLAGLAASLAWVILSNGRQPGAAPSAGSYDRVRNAVGEVLDATGRVASAAVQTAAAASSAAEGAARAMSQTAGSTAERISEGSSAAMASSWSLADQMQQRLRKAGRTATKSSRALKSRVSTASSHGALAAATAVKVARNDPVFTAGIGLALAGIAGVAFGWSGKPVNGGAVGDLANAARGERQAAAEPRVSPITESEAPIIPEAVPAPTIYRADRTGPDVTATWR